MLDLDASIRDQAYTFFAQEAQEFLHVLETGILELRHDRDIPKVHILMRAAHSIKSGAAGIGLQSIQSIAHRLENVFRALYQEEVKIDLNLEELLLQAFDTLRSPLIQQIQTGTHDAEAALQIADPVFSALEAHLGDALHTEYTLPSAEELGIDIVQEIFSGDVPQALARLDRVLANPDTEQVLGEIRALAEVFFGVGELVNLPGFVAIAKATLDALTEQPTNALAIGHIALADFRAAQTAILAGDRTQGGTPSPALLTFTEPAQLSEAVPSDLDNLALNMNALDLEAIFGTSSKLPADIFTETALIDEANSAEDAADPFLDDLEAELSEYALEESPVDLEDLDALFTEDGAAIEVELDEFADLNQWIDSFASNQPQEDSETALQAENTESALTSSLVADDSIGINFSSYIHSATSEIPAQPQPVPTQASPYISNTIKVDLQRLERIDNLVGELVTQEGGAVLQNQQLQGVIGTIARRLNYFEQIAKDLQDWADYDQRLSARLQTSSIHAEVALSVPSGQNAAPLFDPLQLDSYNRLSVLTQSVIEEIAQLGESVRDLTLITQQVQSLQRQKQRTLKQVRNQLLRARMFPIGDILQRFPRMIRDLSAKYHKQVSLKLVGTTTLVDKAVLEKVFDPLVHLVRNAFDHGVELPEVRQAQGKPAQATIEVRAYHRGNQTYIEVRDDGKGINVDRVREKAIAQRLISEEAAALLTKERLYNFLFTPGFSTAAEVSELSGRGVGLDAVMAQIKSLKGSISVTSEPGKGSAFILKFPLTLTIADLLVFSLDSQLMAIPVDSLVAIATAHPAEFQEQDNQIVYQWQNQEVPVYPKSRLLKPDLAGTFRDETRLAIPLPQDGTVPVLLISGNSGVLALSIDQIIQQQELVIKPFGAIVTPPSYLYGCTILGDGSLVPVIDGQALISHYQADPTGVGKLETPNDSFQPPETTLKEMPGTILIVDDSLTARQVLAATLKKAGYQVIQAQDGREAIGQLQKHFSAIQAVFCDVEMPRMNGFEFLNHCRRELPETMPPVIMLTSRSGEKHRQIAKALGARSYLTKPYHEPSLLETLKEAVAN